MGLRPDEFFQMRRKDFYYYRLGFNKKQKSEMIVLRQAAILAGGIAWAKSADDFINSVFPIHGEEQKGIAGMTWEEVITKKAWMTKKLKEKK